MTKYILNIIGDEPYDYKCDLQFCLGFQRGYVEGYEDAKPKWYNMSTDKPYNIIGWTKYENVPTYGETWNPDDTTSYFVSTGDLSAATPKFLVYNSANGLFYVDYMKKFDNINNSYWMLNELEGLEKSANIWWTELPSIPIPMKESVVMNKCSSDEVTNANDTVNCECKLVNNEDIPKLTNEL